MGPTNPNAVESFSAWGHLPWHTAQYWSVCCTPLFQQLETASRVLDLGSGQGAFAAYLERTYPQLSVTCVEPFVQDVYSSKGGVVHESMDTFPLEKGAWDVIVVKQSVHFSSNPKRLLRDARAALCPGGLLGVYHMVKATWPLPEVWKARLQSSLQPTLKLRQEEWTNRKTCSVLVSLERNVYMQLLQQRAISCLQTVTEDEFTSVVSSWQLPERIQFRDCLEVLLYEAPHDGDCVR